MNTATPWRSPAALSLLLLLLVATAGPAAARGGIEAEGAIEALGASSVTVQGLTFAVTDQTSIVDDDAAPLTFADLSVGLYVEVDGRQLGDGSLVADEIKLDDDGDDDDQKVEAEGLVTARTDASVTVGGLTFAVTEQTSVVDDDDGPLPFSAIVVGLYVEVEGVMQSDGALVATEIEVEDDDHQEVEVEGVIEALSPASLTVSGIAFALTDETVVVDDDGHPLSLDTLAVGLYVEVDGTYGADGTLEAREIEVEDFDDDELELRGAIEALGDASLTVLGVAFVVTDQTLFEGQDDQPIAFADLALGDVVEVHAVLAADGTRIATRVELEDGADGQQEIEVQAALDATGAGVVIVLGRPFVVTATTQILGLNDEPIALAGLPVGQSVEIDARRDADGTLVALRIEREDDPADFVRLQARVTGLAPDVVSVMTVPFAAASAQVIRVDGSAGTLADLEVGQDVRVTGTQDATGVQADVIEIRRAAQAAGRIAQTGEGGFALPGLGVATTAATWFVTEDGAPASAADLAAGTAVRAFVTLDGDGAPSASRVVILDAPNAVADESAPRDAGLAIERVFPNPTAAAATVRFSLARAGAVQITVLDVLGRVVYTLDRAAAAGPNDVRLEAGALPAGSYQVRLTVDGRAAGTSRLTVVR